MLATTILLGLTPLIVKAQYSATYTPNNLPATTENGQSGTNQCGTTSSQTSTCQTMYVNSISDFCLWGPPGTGESVGSLERDMVAYCTQPTHGTRLFAPNTFSGVHFVQTPDYVQITGVGDFTTIGIAAGDSGGELDPHGADGNGNPIGGVVFSDAFGGKMQQIHEWTNFMSDSQFCIRACNPSNTNAYLLCNHVYDVMGCEWNMPGNYNGGTFETCLGQSDTPMGLYPANGNPWGSTFSQGQPQTPNALPASSSSQCTSFTALPVSLAAQNVTSSASSSGVSSSGVSLTSTSTVVVTATGSRSSATLASVTVTSASGSTKPNSANSFDHRMGDLGGVMGVLGLAGGFIIYFI